MLNFLKKVWNWFKKAWGKIVLFTLAVLLTVFVLIPVGAKVYRTVRNWTDSPVDTNQVVTNPVDTDQVVANPVDTDQVITNPVDTAPATVEPIAVTTAADCSQYKLDLGSLGGYTGVWDENFDTCTLGIWQESIYRDGLGLAAFKTKATCVAFIMPFNGHINNSAGHISVNGIEWILGNPAKDNVGNSHIPSGATVSVWTDGPNDSAGFQLWQNK